jgi:site-specific DNA-adenine methylase
MTVRKNRSNQGTEVTKRANLLQPFGYPGGKTRFCAEIAGLLDYDNTAVYVEAFGGGYAVGLHKVPHDTEIYIEKSVSLCCFWQCMSDKSAAIELMEKLYATDYDQMAFEHFHNAIDEAEARGRRLTDLPDGEVLDLAAACFITITTSRDNAGLRYHDGRQIKHAAYLKAVDRLAGVADRFSGTEIIHADALDILDGDRFNSADVMIYLDPVYLPEMGKKYTHNHTLYRHNFTYAEHIRLLQRIRKMKAKLVLSGYADDTDLYDRYLLDGEGFDGADFRPWERYEIETISSVAKGDKKRTEVLWANS